MGAGGRFKWIVKEVRLFAQPWIFCLGKEKTRLEWTNICATQQAYPLYAATGFASVMFAGFLAKVIATDPDIKWVFCLLHLVMWVAFRLEMQRVDFCRVNKDRRGDPIPEESHERADFHYNHWIRQVGCLQDPASLFFDHLCPTWDARRMKLMVWFSCDCRTNPVQLSVIAWWQLHKCNAGT